MVPPLKGGMDDPRAPLSKWTIFTPEETRKACVEERSSWLEAFIQRHSVGRVRVFRLSECLASDDPRLKGKVE
jgi:hypothetical protein